MSEAVMFVHMHAELQCVNKYYPTMALTRLENPRVQDKQTGM